MSVDEADIWQMMGPEARRLNPHLAPSRPARSLVPAAKPQVANDVARSLVPSDAPVEHTWTIPVEPFSQNAWNRANQRQRIVMRAEIRSRAAEAFRLDPVVMEPPVLLVWRAFRRRLADPINMAQAAKDIEDGLVLGGMIADDSGGYVAGHVFLPVVKAEVPRMEVTVRRVTAGWTP